MRIIHVLIMLDLLYEILKGTYTIDISFNHAFP